MFLFLSLLLIPLNRLETDYFRGPASIEETRTKIAIIDTGIILNDKTKRYLCYGKHYDLTQTGVNDQLQHGTNVAGIIAKQIDTSKFCLLIIKYYDTGLSGKKMLDNSIEAFKIAQRERVKFINFSSGGTGSTKSEKIELMNIIDQKIYFITAAGNNSENLSQKSCNYFPACYNFKNPYFRIVGNGLNNKPQQQSNYGEIVTDWRNGKNIEGFGIIMSGASQATAILTSELVSKK